MPVQRLPEAPAGLRDIALDHQSDLDAFTSATGKVAAQMWAEIDPDHIVSSWTRQVPELTAVVAGAQRGAARRSDAYTAETLAEQDLDTSAAEQVLPEGFAGTASDGRPLESLLMNPVFQVLTMIPLPMSPKKALSAGGLHLDTIVRTQVADAGRLADQSSLVAHRGSTGYVRVTDGNPCSRCLILAGKTYRWNSGFLRHPRCGCTHVPTLVANPRWRDLDPRALYDAMTPAERLRAGFSLADQEALALGGDLNQVVNARRGVYTAGRRRLTREGATRRGLFGGFEMTPQGLRRRPPGAPIPARLTPDEIFTQATSRDEAIRLLVENRYLIQDVPRALETRAASIVDRLAIRPELAAARTTEEISVVLAARLTQITGRPVEVRLTGSAATARDHAEGILRVQERFPAARVDRIVSGATDGPYALTNRSEIIFSDDWAGVNARRDYLAAVQADMRSRFHPAGTNTPVSVGMHEMAHSVPFDRRAVEQLARGRAGEISTYAIQDVDEAVAEAIVDVLTNGERASLLSREIVGLIDRPPSVPLPSVRPRPGVRPRPSVRPRASVRPGQFMATAPDPSRLSIAALKERAAAKGVTTPTGLRKPALVRLVQDLDSGMAPKLARERAVRTILTERQAVAEALRDAAEMAANAGSPKAMAFLAGQIRRRVNVDVAKTLRPLLEALDAGDVARVQTALTSVARTAKLKPVGSAGEVLRVDATRMTRIGESGGDVVRVVRPGYETTFERQTTLLVRADVVGATPEQVARLAPVKAAKAAAPRAPAGSVRWTAPDRPPIRTHGTLEHSAGPLGEVRVTSVANERIEGRTLKEHARIIAGLRPDDVGAYLDWHAFRRDELELLRHYQARLISGDVKMQLGANIKPFPWPKAETRELILRDAANAARKATPTMRAEAKAYAASLKAKKVAAPKPPPAPEKLSIPALKTELQKRIDAAPAEFRIDLAGIPKPQLVAFVERSRAWTGTEKGFVEELGRWRQVIVEKRRALADALIEADELVANGASAATLASRAAARLRRLEQELGGWPELVEARKVLAAMGTGDAAKIRRAVKAAQRKIGLEQIGVDAGKVAKYDAKVMSPIGGEKITPGADVVVVRPGYAVDIGGERIVLAKPVVEAHGARPVPIHDLMDADDATIERALRDVYEGQFGPYTTKVEVHITRGGTRVDSRGRTRKIEPSIGVSGKIYDQQGRLIGDFGRSIGPAEIHYPGGVVRREIWADHAIVQMDPKFQGKGFGTEFNRRAIEWYRSSGVHGISLSDHNGYVWASQGFNFNGGVVPQHTAAALRGLIADIRAGRTRDAMGVAIPKRLLDAPDLDEQLAAAEELLRRLARTSPGEPGYPTAFEMSQLGRGTKRGKTATWLGKHFAFENISTSQMILNPTEGTVIR